MPLSWIHPRQKVIHRWYESQYWESIANTLERGGFDMLFLADSLHGGNTPDQIKYAIQFPVHDPVALVTYLSATVKKLGFAVTMSTTFSPVFSLARTLSTLDHLTHGRVGWNIVASFGTGEARNFGLDDLPAHAERYDRADEYMQACYALWNSWEDDAMVVDMEQQVFADPAKVHRADFVGRWYKTQGPFTVVPSPRRRPFLFQAGQSERGKSFAAKHADGIFSVARGRGQMRAYCTDIAERAERNRRDPASIPILWAAAPLVAASETQARERYDEIRSRIPLAASLAQMSAHWDVDLSEFDIDRSVADLEVPGIKGLFEIYSKADPEVTLREIAKTYLSGGDRNPFVGTPVQVADAMQSFLEEGGGNGFQLTPSYYAPEYFADLVRLLVPELKRRGVFRDAYAGITLREHLTSAA